MLPQSGQIKLGSTFGLVETKPGILVKPPVDAAGAGAGVVVVVAGFVSVDFVISVVVFGASLVGDDPKLNDKPVDDAPKRLLAAGLSSFFSVVVEPPNVKDGVVAVVVAPPNEKDVAVVGFVSVVVVVGLVSDGLVVVSAGFSQ